MQIETSTRSHPTPTTAAPDLQAIKARQQKMWGSGDYAVIGATLPIVAEELCEAADVRAGERVLDVATGAGNGAIAAAGRFAHAVGIDYVPALLERGRDRAAAERLEVDLREGDAESIPFADGSFDVVMSTFGVMFAPDQQRAADELARVCRRGGRIGLASWTPEGFIGEMFRTVGRHVPPPAGVRPPPLWGAEERLRELFGDTAAEMRFERKEFAFRYLSAPHFVEVFRRWYGPTVTAFAGLDPQRQAQLASELDALCSRHHRGGPGLVVPSEYLEAVITRA
jgi:SAM-dependent methyltransferase